MLDRGPKRRRLTPVNAPFRSPLRRPSTQSSPSDPSQPSCTPVSTGAGYSTPQRPRPSRQFKSPVFARDDERELTPDILALIHRKRELEAAIKEEMRGIETAEMALKYEKQGEDDNLEKLVVKWRRCAQRAAEQVFVNSRNRIDQMGGFREFIKSQRRPSSWDDDEQNTIRGSQTEGRDEREEAGEEEDLGDEFTMEIMLKIAGVDEKLMGWDRELNNFIKD